MFHNSRMPTVGRQAGWIAGRQVGWKAGRQAGWKAVQAGRCWWVCHDCGMGPGEAELSELVIYICLCFVRLFIHILHLQPTPTRV
jgi:hypothetical protein